MSAAEVVSALGLADTHLLLGQVTWGEQWRSYGPCDVCPTKAAVWITWWQVVNIRSMRAHSLQAVEHGPQAEPEVHKVDSGACLAHAAEAVAVIQARDDRMPDTHVEVELCGWAPMWGTSNENGAGGADKAEGDAVRVVLGEDAVAELMLAAATARRILDGDRDDDGGEWDALEALTAWAENLVSGVEVAA